MDGLGDCVDMQDVRLRGKLGLPRPRIWPPGLHLMRKHRKVGRVQRAVWRALVAASGRNLTTSEVLVWAPGVFRSNVRRAAYRFAERVDGGAREAVWRLKPE
jgi:hypothetical protein